MNLILWLTLFVPALLVEILCWITNPIACLFTVSRERTDVVKRFNKQVITMQRDYLIPFFYLWQTHDNAVDEGWYGLYEIPFLKNKTQSDYARSWLIQYWCRVWWLSRNTAYGWHYKYFSRPKEDAYKVFTYGVEDQGFWYSLQLRKSSFQLEAQIPLSSKRFYSLNIGWKAHKEMEKLLYANRFIGIRRY